MLVLSRKKEESIVIGSNVEVRVLKIKGNIVRIGIKAPDDVKILRKEVCPYETIDICLEDEADDSDENMTAEIRLPLAHHMPKQATHGAA